MSLRIGSVLFALTCIAQLAYPASMIVGHERILRVGTPVRIHCQAVDPSDILRGRYVRLRLETFTAPVENPEDYHGSPTVYALLETDAAGFARLVGIRDRAPERILHMAVRRMLPKNKLATVMLSKLKMYVGSEHPHQAQQPEAIELGKSAS